MVPPHGKRLPAPPLLGLQDHVVPRQRARNVPEDRQGHRHEGLCQFQTHRTDRDRLLVRLGQRRLRPSRLGLRRPASQGRRPSARDLPRHRSVNRGDRRTDARGRRSPWTPEKREGRRGRRGQLLHGPRRAQYRGGARLQLRGLVELDRKALCSTIARDLTSSRT